MTSPIDSADPGDEFEDMCNRYQPGERQVIISLFKARDLRQVLDQMTWGFPVVLTGKTGQPLNNARFDKLGAFWRRWASAP